MDEPSNKSTHSFFDRLLGRHSNEPDDKQDLIELLRGAVERNLLDANAFSMIEGVLVFTQQTVDDVMIPRSQMDVIKVDDPIERFLPFVVEQGHSRFPVICDSGDDVVGILLAKDLLRYFTHPDTFELRSCLRPATFVPEAKRLDVLLRDFQLNHNHMAIVVDEYGGVSGLVTIEDVIEVIVGEIEDEFDEDDEENIIPIAGDRYRVNAVTEIADFNQFFSTTLDDDEVDTIGGYLLNKLGYLPAKGEVIDVGPLRITVVRADNRRLHTLVVSRQEDDATMSNIISV